MVALHCSLLIAVFPFLVLGAQKRSTPSQFQLYAYGQGIGGPAVFFADGYAYFGNPDASNSTDAATAIFSPGDSNAWLGSPNTTSLSNSTHNPTWSNVTLFIPTTDASDKRVGYLSSNESSDSTQITSNFVFYGSTAMHNGDDGLETQWTGLSTGNAGIYALYWNDTSSGQVPVTLRRVGPSNPDT